MKSLRVAIVGMSFLLLTGCTTYYQVTDPTSGKIYYTTKSEMDQSNSGSTTFTDARTGDKVTLQNTVVSTITQQQYDNGKNGTATTQN
jgi:hypothetical protein